MTFIPAAHGNNRTPGRDLDLRSLELGFDPLEHIGSRSFEHSGQSHESAKRRILLASFQLADIRGVVVALERKRLLREPLLLSNLAQNFPKSFFELSDAFGWSATLGHSQTDLALTCIIVPETIVQIDK